MKALQKMAPLSWWLFRITILIFIFARYNQAIRQFDFNSATFYISALFLLSASLIVIGGFYKKGTLARVSGFLLIVVSAYEAYLNSTPLFGYTFSQYAMLCAIGLIFLTRKENI
jgi:hypothetical protein